MNRIATPLFDVTGYIRHLEGLYETMWQRYRDDGQGPRPSVLPWPGCTDDPTHGLGAIPA